MTAQHHQDYLATIAQKLEEADAVLVGGASGMSTANQHDFYGYSRYFRDNFSEFQDAYGIRNLCDALYYRYQSSEERWAYLSKHGALLYDEPPGQTYVDLHALIKDMNYFVVTTNQDLQFSKLFPEEKLCYPQGTSHYLFSNEGRFVNVALVKQIHNVNSPKTVKTQRSTAFHHLNACLPHTSDPHAFLMFIPHVQFVANTS